MKPIIAFHKDADGNVLDAKATEYSFELESWMRSLRVEPGDSITFSEKTVRKDEVEAAKAETVVSITKSEKVKA